MAPQLVSHGPEQGILQPRQRSKGSALTPVPCPPPLFIWLGEKPNLVPEVQLILSKK